MGRTALLSPLLLAALLAGCSALPDKPTRPAQYDFGPGPVADAPTDRRAPLAPLALDEVEAAGPLEAGTAVLYRLGYADAQQLRPYAQARWSMPPAQLVRQRLREQLGQRRTVVGAGEGAAMLRNDGRQPLVLRVELLEFSQLFTAPAQSAGLMRLRATVVDNLPAGEKVLAQRQVIVQRPAPTADAAGGVRALAEATDAAAAELSQWLETVAR
ncbi:ABC-type transport auxiliary lipoprotein family protein [Pseudorhodoferax sp. Leaf265]|uniref:ABC-type transport auxiliary lipoprotein family protein n=1 Tax=Pseudorhodoferax sp. Leaf265 TaxID=1736315 RepID=UPI000B0C2D8D|nr:ABC-type transport auxiliary lipoprotein family protein [Pseudorhodoferax sp. Leaf265]